MLPWKQNVTPAWRPCQRPRTHDPFTTSSRLPRGAPFFSRASPPSCFCVPLPLTATPPDTNRPLDCGGHIFPRFDHPPRSGSLWLHSGLPCQTSPRLPRSHGDWTTQKSGNCSWRNPILNSRSGLLLWRSPFPPLPSPSLPLSPSPWPFGVDTDSGKPSIRGIRLMHAFSGRRCGLGMRYGGTCSPRWKPRLGDTDASNIGTVRPSSCLSTMRCGGPRRSGGLCWYLADCAAR